MTSLPALALTLTLTLASTLPNQLAASRRALAKGDPRLSKGSAGAPPASKRPVRKELVLRPVRTEPMPLDDYIAKLYTVPPRRVRG